MKITVRASELQIGDFLIATERTITWRGQTINTPKGKITVHVQRATTKT